MIGAALAIASLVSSAYGSHKSAQANRAIDQQLAGRQSELESWYNTEYNQSYLDTAESKSAITVLRNQIREEMKKVDQNNAITGASDEKRVATATEMNKKLGDNVTKMAGFGTQHKDNIRRQYLGVQNNLDNMTMANLKGKSENWSNFSSNALNAAGGAVEADANGAFDKWDGKIKNWWGSGSTPGTNMGTIAPDIIKDERNGIFNS